MANRTRKSQIKTKHEKELENLFEHRRSRFMQIFPDGWPVDEIEELAGSSVSPHDAEDLLNNGCPPELIKKILL
jgi:hypothetical protein